jgi:hypothetical protein
MFTITLTTEENREYIVDIHKWGGDACKETGQFYVSRRDGFLLQRDLKTLDDAVLWALHHSPIFQG